MWDEWVAEGTHAAHLCRRSEEAWLQPKEHDLHSRFVKFGPLHGLNLRGGKISGLKMTVERDSMIFWFNRLCP
jgi:hypothetical protein